jgi:hypothetical protein
MKSKQPTKSKTTHERPARLTKPGPQTPSVSNGLHAQIAKQAYEIYQRRIHQGALDDWLQAEREILRQQKTGNLDMLHRGGYASEEQG